MFSLHNCVKFVFYKPLLESANSIFNRFSPIPREMKILFVSALAFVLLGGLIYRNFFWTRSAKIISNISEKPNQNEKAVKKNTSLDINPMGDEVSLPSENVPSPPSENILNISSENSLKISSENVLNNPLLPSKKLKMNSSNMFKNLAFLTEHIETLPYSANNCQFKDILCPKETLVEVHGKTESLYLHANHVELDGIPMILTQYPLKLHFPLFWRLCENACLVVDLTNDKDMKSGLKSYAPQYNQSILCDNVSITCVSEEALAGLNASLCTYRVDEGYSNAKPYEVKRIHYKDWNDHQGITETDMDLLLCYMQQYTSLRSEPVVIHCRAGVGRSGTIAVAFAMSHLIKKRNVDPSNRIETINRLILEGRKKRGPGFVQNSRQLEAIWKWSEIAIQK